MYIRTIKCNVFECEIFMLCVNLIYCISHCIIIMIYIMYSTNPSNTPEKTLYRLIACCLIHFLWR